jgi:hypothetical protein
MINMITFLLITGLVISLIVNILTIIISGVQANKVRTYEEWILKFKQDVETTLENMRALDTRGTFATSLNDKGLFESDDEVGAIFKEIQDLIEELNQRTQ